MNWLERQFELSRSGHSQNLLPMEGLRGLAVTLVFLVHYSSLVAPWIQGLSGQMAVSSVMHAIGNSGVDLFFVLSGYLIYGSLIEHPQPFAMFMWRRVERIYPTFLVVFTVYLVLSFVFSNESKLPKDPTAAALYVIANVLLLPGIFPIEPIISVAWSLSYELFFYLLIPLVIGVLGLRERGAAWRTGFFLITCAAMLAGYVFWGGPIRLVMFVAGMLLSEATQAGKGKNTPGILGFAALLMGVFLAIVPMPFKGGLGVRVVLMALAFYVVCLVCLNNPRVWFSKMFTWRLIRWLGNMSYSYYLLHGLVLKACFLLLAGIYPSDGLQGSVFWLGLPVSFLLTVFFSSLLFLSVERPWSLAPKKRAPSDDFAVVAMKGQKRSQ